MNRGHMVAGSEESKRQDFTINNVQGQELITIKFEQTLGPRNLGSHVEVVEMIIGIQNGPETYQ